MRVPGWMELADGLRPGQSVEVTFGPGIFNFGWQFYAARALDARCRAQVLSRMLPSDRALLRSQSCPGAGAAFTAIPTDRLLRIEPSIFRVLLLRRLRLPLPLTAHVCRCRLSLDRLGHHRAACPHAGVLVRRGAAVEVAAARVCREAGARVRANVFVRDWNCGVGRPDDGRRIEIMAMGLPIYHGAQLAVDTTLVSALRRDGSPRPGAADVDGVALVAARRRKERTYPELHAEGGRARLVVAALEVGGRWSSEAWTFVRLLARARAQQEPDLVRASAALA